jgi:hypothetical protein
MRDAFKTIVGGRSVDNKPMGNSPRGMEILLKKAAVDEDFAKILLESPEDAARLISLKLHNSERRILLNTPRDTLQTMIRHTTVKRHQLSAFKTLSASLMLAAIVAIGSTGCECDSESQQTYGATAYDAPTSAEVKMVALQEALEAYKADHNLSYPRTAEWNGSSNPLKQYVNTNELYDPWNNAFRYESVEQDGHVINYRLKSCGPDGMDSDDDVQCPIDPDQHSW